MRKLGQYSIQLVSIVTHPLDKPKVLTGTSLLECYNDKIKIP